MKTTEEIIQTFKEKFHNAHLITNWAMEECNSNQENSPFCTCQQELEAFLTSTITDIQREASKAGFQEGRERTIAMLLHHLDIAKQNKESADDPDDPKIRIKYLEHLLLTFEE